MAEAARVLQLEPDMDRKAAHLSGGQRQRAATGWALAPLHRAFLAGALLSDPDARLRGPLSGAHGVALSVKDVAE